MEVERYLRDIYDINWDYQGYPVELISFDAFILQNTQTVDGNTLVYSRPYLQITVTCLTRGWLTYLLCCEAEKCGMQTVACQSSVYVPLLSHAACFLY